jgi:hypothetical protein
MMQTDVTPEKEISFRILGGEVGAVSTLQSLLGDVGLVCCFTVVDFLDSFPFLYSVPVEL